ncbi:MULTISPECIES: hypothetical protein [unclassified Sutcliffiella]|uniref:hypothetical protein n=1 Tax=unclassified Sutcliffiella TaxID=2837532 RepID=UPI0030D3291D
MNSGLFIEAIVKYVRDSAIEDTVCNMEDPPGRKPRQKDLELAEWYNEQSASNKKMIKKALYEAVDTSLFGLFTVLDGVRPVENITNKGTLKLYFEKDGKRTLLNDIDNVLLHDIYNAITNPTD